MTISVREANDIIYNSKPLNDDVLMGLFDVLKKVQDNFPEKLFYSEVDGSFSTINQLVLNDKYPDVCDLYIEKIFIHLSYLQPSDYQSVLPRLMFKFLPSSYQLEDRNKLLDFMDGMVLTEDEKKSLRVSLGQDLLSNLYIYDDFMLSFQKFNTIMNRVDEMLMKHSKKYCDFLNSVTDNKDLKPSSALLKAIKFSIEDLKDYDLKNNTQVAAANTEMIDLLTYYIKKIELNRSLNDGLLHHEETLSVKRKI